jgi:hypothetical protein
VKTRGSFYTASVETGPGFDPDHPAQSSLSVSVPFGKEAANAIQHELVVIWLSDRRLFLA